MSIESAVRLLDERFQESPLNYTVEQALQAELVSILRSYIGTEITARAGYNQSDATSYKQKYLDRIARPQTIHNIQPEVNIGTPGNNRRIDIAILEPVTPSEYGDLEVMPEAENTPLTIRLYDGSKYFPVEAVKHAIEIKYIKNVDIAGARLERDDVQDWPYFSSDLSKLSSLNNAESRHLIVVTNKNPFQQAESDSYSTNTARERFQRVKKECEVRDITVTELHPDP